MKTKTKQTDWKKIAQALAGDVLMAIQHLTANGGTGLLYNRSTGKTTYWKDRFADHLDMIPGWKVDRSVMRAFDLPKKQRDKFFREIKKKQAAHPTTEA